MFFGCKIKVLFWYISVPKSNDIVCKKVTGKTAFHWINEYMMKDIRHLLKDTDKSVKEEVEPWQIKEAYGIKNL